MNKEVDRNPRKALGKGLSALLPTKHNPSAVNGQSSPPPPQVPVAPAPDPPQIAKLPENFEEFQGLPLSQIQPSEKQPREHFDDERLQELAHSIQAHGIIQPITVRKIGPNQYRIVAGERRWRAARMAGLTEIPALVRIVPPNELLELALIENIQREDLNPIEVATAFQQLISEHHLSHEQVAERTGKDRSTVTNFLRLLKLAPSVRQQLIDGAISMGHARAILSLDAARQEQACVEINKNQLSVRQVEALVRRLTEEAPPRAAQNHVEVPAKHVDPNVKAALEDMSMALGTRVRIVARSETSGRLEIEYYSQDDLDRIYSVITKS